MSAEPSHAQGGCSELFACKPDSAWLRRAGKPLRGNKLVPAGVRAMAAELLRQELEATDRDIIRALKQAGLLRAGLHYDKFAIGGELGGTLYPCHATHGPVCELRRVIDNCTRCHVERYFEHDLYADESLCTDCESEMHAELYGADERDGTRTLYRRAWAVNRINLAELSGLSRAHARATDGRLRAALRGALLSMVGAPRGLSRATRDNRFRGLTGFARATLSSKPLTG
ncbi:hypothetical protein Q3G72_006139 [Acer saccharum]|nr:hypothetical protein Q3G72_006139 [Acer saccharum]